MLEWGIAPCTSLVIPHFRPQTVLAHVELKRMSLWERLMHPLQAMADFGRFAVPACVWRAHASLSPSLGVQIPVEHANGTHESRCRQAS